MEFYIVFMEEITKDLTQVDYSANKTKAPFKKVVNLYLTIF